ncbi:LysE family translocator [Marinomonas agarivorans]|nr:LysE family translocator [Marinomonas agarivorans]
MTDLLSLISTGLAFFVIAVSPGPATISNATIAMSRGRKVSLIYGAGLSSGLVFWGLIAASGMGAILQTSVYLLMVLKVFGGLYLLWLAFLSTKAAAQPVSENNAFDVRKGWFLKGLILNVSNPKTVIAWMAALSVGLTPESNNYAIAAAVSVCIFVGFCTNAMYSFVFSVKSMMTIYQKSYRWVNGVMAGLFSLAGLSLIRSAFTK